MLTPPSKEFLQLKKTIESKNITPEQIHNLNQQLLHPERAQTTTHKLYKGSGVGKRIRFGLTSDWHVGSIHTDPNIIKETMRWFKDEKVEAVYHAGDITEGYDRRKGHALECNLHGADAQIRGVIEQTPDIGKPIYFITGNHDHWHRDNGGIEVGRWIERLRDDFHYLGAFSATAHIAKNTTMMLTHPEKGTSYALSYQVQKQIEGLPQHEKPDILAVGHYHKMEYFFYQNVHAFQTGCLQNQSSWMKRMNLAAHQGAWVVDVNTDSKGRVKDIGMKAKTFYT